VSSGIKALVFISNTGNFYQPEQEGTTVLIILVMQKTQSKVEETSILINNVIPEN
jgi:hypothetical protein